MNPACYAPPALVLFLIQSLHLDPDCSRILSSSAEVPVIPIWIYLSVFLLTCLLESPFYFFILRKRPLTIFQKVLAILLCNLATHPVVCFGIPYIMSKLGGSYGIGNTLGELFAPAVEAFILYSVYKVPGRLAISGSVLANIFSWWAGVYFISLVPIF